MVGVFCEKCEFWTIGSFYWICDTWHEVKKKENLPKKNLQRAKKLIYFLPYLISLFKGKFFSKTDRILLQRK
jgi:hypothetical protein